MAGDRREKTSRLETRDVITHRPANMCFTFMFPFPTPKSHGGDPEQPRWMLCPQCVFITAKKQAKRNPIFYNRNQANMSYTLPQRELLSLLCWTVNKHAPCPRGRHHCLHIPSLFTIQASCKIVNIIACENAEIQETHEELSPIDRYYLIYLSIYRYPPISLNIF